MNLDECKMDLFSDTLTFQGQIFFSGTHCYLLISVEDTVKITSALPKNNQDSIALFYFPDK